MQARVYAALDGWRWRLWTDKGALLAESGRAFPSLEECRSALGRLPDDLAGSQTEYVRTRTGWRWRLTAGDAFIVAESDRTFFSRFTCQLGLMRFVRRFNRLQHYGVRYAGPAWRAAA